MIWDGVRERGKEGKREGERAKKKGKGEKETGKGKGGRKENGEGEGMEGGEGDGGRLSKMAKYLFVFIRFSPADLPFLRGFPRQCVPTSDKATGVRGWSRVRGGEKGEKERR